MSPERDDYLDDDLEAPEPARGGVLAAGWLRALLVLGGLAVLLVVTVPYIIEWVAPSQPLPKPVARTVPEAPPAPSTAAAPTDAPSTTTATPAPASAPTSEPKAEPKPEPRPELKAEAPAKKTEPASSPAKPASEPKVAPTPVKTAGSKPAVVARVSEPRPAKAAAPSPKATAGAVKPAPTPAAKGDYWVQVGLFASSDNAERLARELRDERFNVEVAQTTRNGAAAAAPTNQHEVLVTGSTVDAVTAALKGTGTAEAGDGMILIRPALDLKGAVTLSRRLADEGFQVRIRRVAASPAEGTLYLVRVGGYASRDAAAVGKRELAAKGVGGFVTQGPVK